ncbi:MAG: DUF2971 domain-containing protein [Chitinophagaceae bacterium]|nr:DUF2971 domain-containing protein [Chitinophagaceae bacterium]MCO5284971.1 hypothetical protein [Chitinophagaceae bacterium]MCZ2396488.1 hypothetical protein [Chitinophagales bacterium]
MYKELIKELETEYLEEVVRPSFPFIKHFERVSWSDDSVSAPKVSFRIPETFSDFEGSDYYYPNADKFIHYTSFRNTVNIINDGFFRMNSLQYLDDPQELLYAGNEILGTYEKDELKDLKDQIFCISFCDYSKNGDNFDSWRLYGDNGLGVGIVFHFSSPTKGWRSNYLSKIHYGKNNLINTTDEKYLKKFSLFRENHDKFIKKNKEKVNLLSNPFGRQGKIPEWIGVFLGFHKNGLYAIENEVRFLRFHESFDQHSFVLNNRNEKTYFDKLYIKTEANLKCIKEKTKDQIFKAKPNIWNSKWLEEATLNEPIAVIDKLIIGYRQEKDFEIIQESLSDGFNKKNKQKIDVELSPLARVFNPKQ